MNLLHQTGMKGRTGVYELLVPDETMRDAITSGASLEKLRELAPKAGLVKLLAAGMAKVRSGETTLEEVLRITAA